MALPPPVSVLLLGSGWTSRFLLPALKACNITHAYTRRKPSDCEVDAIPFKFDENHSSFQKLPKAKMVVIIFPLTSNQMADDIIEGYERATGCIPAWVALGSTSAWSKGIIKSTSPISESSARAKSEEHLLTLHTLERLVSVLNLSGLYGNGRNPVNFGKKVGETKEKLEGKTSLHLVHGKDVSQAIIGLYESLKDTELRKSLWGKRWIVTDTHVYDWWQLFTTLRPAPNKDGKEWVQELCQKYGIFSLPRKVLGQEQEFALKDAPPYFLDRALDGESFWQALGKRPLIGRCDDYTNGGGGFEIEEDEKRLKESL